MSQKPIIQTKRLILRQWCAEDFEHFAHLNADPKVMEFFPSTLSREESNKIAHRMQLKIEEQGYGFWVAAIPGLADFIGFIGLNSLDKSIFPVHFAPAVEIGWRLDAKFWGKGYATEGALACLEYGFASLNLREIVSFTAVQNMRSRAVMQRIGMHHNVKDDFDHPKLPKEHKLSRHALYRIAIHEQRKGKL